MGFEPMTIRLTAERSAAELIFLLPEAFAVITPDFGGFSYINLIKRFPANFKKWGAWGSNPRPTVYKTDTLTN